MSRSPVKTADELRQLDDRHFFKYARDHFVQSLDAEINKVSAAITSHETFFPSFNFYQQEDDLPGVAKPTRAEKDAYAHNTSIDLAAYQTKLMALRHELNQLGFTNAPVTFVKAIQGLLLIADINLPIFRTNDVADPGVKLPMGLALQRTNDFLKHPPPELNPEQAAILDRIRTHYSGFDFSHLKNSLLAEIAKDKTNETSSTGRKLLMADFERTLNQLLNFDSDKNCFAVLAIFFDFQSRGGNTKSVINNTLNRTENRKNFSIKEFQAVINNQKPPEESTVASLPQTLEEMAEKMRTVQADHKLRRGIIVINTHDFNFSTLKKELSENMRGIHDDMAKNLLNMREDDPARTKIIKIAKALNKLNTALSGLNPSQKDDHEKMAQIALYFVYELRGTRTILTNSFRTGESEAEKNESLRLFQTMFTYQKEIGDSIVNPTPKPVTPLRHQSIFTDNNSDSDKEADASAQLSRKDTMPPHKPGT